MTIVIDRADYPDAEIGDSVFNDECTAIYQIYDIDEFVIYATLSESLSPREITPIERIYQTQNY